MEKEYKCKLGEQKLHCQSKLSEHVVTHSNVRRSRKNKHFKCNLCGYGTQKEVQLLDHTRSHTGERPFKCTASGCSMAFKLKHTLENHILYKHNALKSFKCKFPSCDVSVKTRQALISHTRVHSDDRPFACPNEGCNHRAKRKAHMKEHIRNRHMDAKRYACEKCNYKTNNSQNLKDHSLRHHMKRKQFKCPLCVKRCATQKQLRHHIVVHTNEKPFECGHCEYTGARHHDGKTHISKHHDDIKFPFIVRHLNEYECLRCKMTLPSAKFLIHSMDHFVPLVKIQRLAVIVT